MAQHLRWPNTCGGPRRAAGRARNPFDEPIEGRYAAGKLGRPVGMLYPADGANLSEASCSGRIAARAALGGGAAPQLVGKATG
ncbi:hypothetical protein [Pseudonocardia sp. GCM10023141]|uniref:hypothetical protein n=1 Tax=Pseudonocardia sp. GCM10023141 TaxID=3252653 RepID=UPI0036141193